MYTVILCHKVAPYFQKLLRFVGEGYRPALVIQHSISITQL